MKKLLIVVLTAAVAAVSCTKQAPQKEIGLQLYSIRDLVGSDELYAQNHESVFKELKEMGYSYVESAIYQDRKFHGATPDQFKADVEAAGLKFRSSHVSHSLTDEQIATGDFSEALPWWRDAIEDHKAAGVEYMIMANTYTPEDNYPQTAKVLAEYLNTIGAMAREAGIQFGYHNHDTEFEKIQGVRFYDYINKNTDPENLFMEMDVYWITHANASPIRYFKRYPGRFKMIHARDEAEIGQSGLVGYDAIFRNAELAGIKDVVVELGGGSYDDILRTCRESAEYIQNTDFIKY